MTLVHIPFQRGEDQSVDPKVAPLGVLKSAQNVRFARDGRVVKRPGFDVTSLATDGTTTQNPLTGVAALMRRENDQLCITSQDGMCVLNSKTGQWSPVGNAALSPGADFAAGERFQVARNRSGQTLRGAVAYANGYICCAFESSGKIYVNLYTESDVTLVATKEITGGSSTCKRPKLVACGSTFIVLFLDTFGGAYTINQAAVDTSTSPPAIGGRASVASSHSSNDYFDASTCSSTQYLLVYQNSSTTMTIGRYGTNGSASATNIFNAAGPMGIAGGLNERASVAWKTSGGDLNLQTFNFALASSVGPTALLVADTTNQGPPAVTRLTATTVCIAQSGDNASGFNHTYFFTFDNTLNASFAPTTLSPYRLASKIAVFNGVPYLWKVTSSAFDRCYVLTRGDTVMPSTFAARSLAPDYLVTDHLGEFVSYTDAAGRTWGLWVFPWISSGSTKSATPFCSIDLMKIEFGGTLRYQNTVVGRALYVAGGLLGLYDGALFYEVGFLDSPEIVSGTGGSGGALTVTTTYQYVVTREWYDAVGQRHISQVSDPLSVTLVSAQNSITVRYRLPGASKRDSGAHEYFVRDHIWRTAGNGTIFQRVTTDAGLPSFVNATGSTTYVDNASDASIAANPILYTQGVRGGLSGPLQHDPPPPCRYLWAGKERMIVGGLENANEVRWSKYFYTGEPIEFSESTNFRKRVPGKVTAVAVLDDSSIVFTKDQVFVVFGDGPDDSGNGTFQEPRALPSDVGCIDWRSVVECSLGLFFQGRSDRLYLLPRGGGSPEWIGQPVRAELEQYPVVTSARLLPDDNLVIFTVTNAAGSAGRVLCFDVRNGQWTVDVIAGGVAHVASALWGTALALATATALDVENRTSGADRAAFFGVVLETAALRPGGLQQDMRTRKVALLGEYQQSCQVKIEMAPDDAQAFAYSRQWDLDQPSVPASGDVFRREWDLPVQKFGACRIRVSEVAQVSGVPTRGAVFHGITLETRARPGMPKLREGYR